MKPALSCIPRTSKSRLRKNCCRSKIPSLATAWSLEAASSPTVREVDSLEALQATTAVVPVDVLRLGATPLLVAHHGVAVALRLAVVLLAGEEEEALATGHQRGAETVGAQHMAVVVVTEIELPMAAETAHGQLMVERLPTEAQLHMVEAHRTAETTARAPHMEASTQAIGRLAGEVPLETRPRNQQAVSPLRLLVHITRPRRVLMRLRLLARTVRTQHLHRVVHLWMLPRQATSRLLHLEKPGTGTEPHLQLRRHQGLGNLQRRHRVETTLGTIELVIRLAV
jgi:hypothetical protein